MNHPPSPMLTELYGEEFAKQVYDRLESLDPELNSLIQAIPYDQFWSRSVLSIRDKSIATIAALVALGRANPDPYARISTLRRE